MGPSAATSVCAFTSEAAHLTLHPAGFLHLTWLPGATSGAATRAVLERVLYELHAQGCCKVLADQRQVGPPSDEDTAWYALDWLPRAAQHGYRYGAILNSTRLFARIAMHSISQQAMQRTPVLYRHFDQEDVAIAWLIAQE